MNKLLKILKLTLAVFLVLAVYTLAGGGGGGGGGGSSSSSSGFSGYGNFNTGGSYGYTSTGPNGLSYGYSSYSHGGFSDYGGGDGGWSGSSWGSYVCRPNYVTCYSSANICGWVNVGTEDVSCGGSCSASRPPDPVFTINGAQKRVGDTCYISDPCDSNKQLQGVVTCEGVCSVKTVNAACLTPDNPDTPQDESENPNNNQITDITDSVETQIISIDIPGNIYPPDSIDDHYVAIYAYPSLLRQGQRTNIYLLAVGLDYCKVKGSNGDVFNYMGVNKVKLDYINDACPGAKDANSESDELSNYTCQNQDIELNPNYVQAGPVTAAITSKLSAETEYTVVECYSVDHKGRVAKYIPSTSKGDKITVRVKIVPKFIEF